MVGTGQSSANRWPGHHCADRGDCRADLEIGRPPTPDQSRHADQRRRPTSARPSARPSARATRPAATAGGGSGAASANNRRAFRSLTHGCARQIWRCAMWKRRLSGQTGNRGGCQSGGGSSATAACRTAINAGLSVTATGPGEDGVSQRSGPSGTRPAVCDRGARSSTPASTTSPSTTAATGNDGDAGRESRGGGGLG